MTDDSIPHVPRQPLEDAFVVEVLRDQLDRLLDICEQSDEGQPAMESTINEILRVLGRSQDPAAWGREVGEGIGEALNDLVPEGDERPPPEFFRLLEAARSIAARGPVPTLAWTYLEFVDADSMTPEQVVHHFSQMLDIPGDVPEEARAAAHLLRGSAREDAGDLAGARADWEAAYALATEEDTKASAAWCLAASHGEDDPVAAADWAWDGAEWDERDEATVDPDMGQDVAWIQLKAIATLVTSGSGAETVLRLARRLLTRPERLPEEITVAMIHLILAGVSVELNDAAGAMGHLDLARSDWARLDEQERAEWHIVRGQVGLLRSDLLAIEQAVRAASPYVLRAGNADRARLQALATAVSGTTGQYQPASNTPFDRLYAMINRIPNGGVRRGDISELHGLAAEFDPVTQPHLTVMALLLAANVAIVVGDYPEARSSIGRARTAYDAPWDSRGVPSMEPYFHHVEVLRVIAEDGDAAAAPVADDAFRDALAGGVLPQVVLWGATAGLLWSRIGNHVRAWEVAVAAVTANQELQRGLGNVEDRQAYHQRAARVVAVAIDSAERLGDPRLMAELLEVLRAQAMPDVDLSAEIASGPIPDLLSALLGPASSLASPSSDRDPNVNLPPTPLIVMPWGGIALGPWLAYLPDQSRAVERILLTPVEADGA
ncbi:MAG: hypothetical protein V9F04_08345 [Dermatophilaceae bacterium]